MLLGDGRDRAETSLSTIALRGDRPEAESLRGVTLSARFRLRGGLEPVARRRSARCCADRRPPVVSLIWTPYPPDRD